MDSTNFSQKPIADTYGDAACFSTSYTFASTAAGARIDLVKLPSGSELLEVSLINDALAASTTLSFGELFASSADGTTSATSLGAAASTASAGRRDLAFHPKTYDSSVTLTATLAGATATGKISVLVKYRFIGTK